MPTVRADIVAALSVHDPAELRTILEAAGIATGGASTARELAERIAESLWWHATTPLGYVADRTFFEDIVQRAARRVGMQHRVDAQVDGWEQLRQLTAALFQTVPLGAVSFDSLDAKTRERLEPSWIPTIGLGAGTGGTASTAWASGRVLAFLKGPFGRLIPLIPPLAPYYRALVAGLGTVRLVAWPLTLGLALLTVNTALGANDRKLVPLLLGVGALGPRPVVVAEEVPMEPVIVAEEPIVHEAPVEVPVAEDEPVEVPSVAEEGPERTEPVEPIEVHPDDAEVHPEEIEVHPDDAEAHPEDVEAHVVADVDELDEDEPGEPRDDA
ncbi:MAG: hypothetical protein H6736_05355 [Alphaproteobacteria bacterium]|nr:hypothetical protein [Alphaproteobacteria bacterium]